MLSTTQPRRSFLSSGALLLLLGMTSLSHVSFADAGEKLTRVAVLDFTSASAKGQNNVMAILTPDAGFECDILVPQDVIDGKLASDGYDIVVMPGGSGSKQAKELGAAGATNVRQFVGGGGGYMGICAGAYLGSSNYKWSLNLMNAKVLDTKHWARGKGQVLLNFTETGKSALGHDSDQGEVRYGQGPLLAPGDNRNLPPYEELASYATEIAENGAPTGVMIGTTAIARSAFGAGHVVLISPHPETPGDLNHLILHAAEWTSLVDGTADELKAAKN